MDGKEKKWEQETADFQYKRRKQLKHLLTKEKTSVIMKIVTYLSGVTLL